MEIVKIEVRLPFGNRIINRTKDRIGERLSVTYALPASDTIEGIITALAGARHFYL